LYICILFGLSLSFFWHVCTYSILFWMNTCSSVSILGTHLAQTGSAAPLPRFQGVTKWNLWKTRGLWNWEPPIFTNFVVEFFKKVTIHDGWVATAIFMVHFWSAIFEFPSSLPHFRSLIALVSQTQHNFRWISAAVRFFAFKSRITARISQLERFSIKLFVLNRCNTTTQKQSLQNLFIFLIPLTIPAELFQSPNFSFFCRKRLFSLNFYLCSETSQSSHPPFRPCRTLLISSDSFTFL
jgi:hypothetical protein